MERSYQSRIATIAAQSYAEHVFGARAGLRHGHQFQLLRHSIREVAEFEEQLGVRLPQEYVQLLVETGSGAGPYYGLLSPTEVLAKIQDLNDVRKEASGEALNPVALFPFRRSDAPEFGLHNYTERRGTSETTWISDGYIPICNCGCTFFDALVTSGELVGTVWTFNYELTWAWWWPAGRPPGLVREFTSSPLSSPPIPPTVRDWYESWLERVEIDLHDYNIIRHSSVLWRLADFFRYPVKHAADKLSAKGKHGES